MEYPDITRASDEIIRELSEKLPEINIVKGLAACVDDEDFYIELFTDFINLDIKEQLVKFMEANDHDNYCIRIHGFKNNAYSVGATALGDLAYEMEKISREALTSEMTSLQASLFEQYDRICLCFIKAAQS